MQVAENGRVYFSYSEGAVYQFTPGNSDAFEYIILGCEYEDNTEYYRIASAGKELSARFSVSQLEFLMNFLPCELVVSGEQIEIPLLLDEVKEFYKAKAEVLKAANVTENAKLKGTAYHSNLKVIASLEKKLPYFKSNGDEQKASELEQNLLKIEEEQNKLLIEKGVDVRILKKICDCDFCKDKGIVDGQICECAFAQADKIKAYNAAKRLAQVQK